LVWHHRDVDTTAVALNMCREERCRLSNDIQRGAVYREDRYVERNCAGLWRGPIYREKRRRCVERSGIQRGPIYREERRRYVYRGDI